MVFPKVKNFLLSFIVILSLANFLAWFSVYQIINKGDFLRVIFFDVGQGDSIFIETLQGHQILIDGGPDDKVIEKLSKFMPFMDKSLDLVILTHPQKDHLAGLIEVLKRYEIENILWTGVFANTKVYKRWLESLKIEKANIFIAKKNQKIKAGNLLIIVLYPFENLENKEIRNLDQSSIVLKLKYGKNTFLLPGDIPRKIEKKLIEENLNFNSDLLKIAHHGSKSSTSQEFLLKVLPEIAIISVGKNRYGHPHKEVLERLAKLGILILRTDREGDIIVISDGINAKVKIQNEK